MLVVATVETQAPTTSTGATTRPVAISIVFLLFFFILFYKPSWGATVWVVTSEVFSMNVRSHAVGMASQVRPSNFDQPELPDNSLIRSSQTQNVANIIVNRAYA